MVSMSRTQTQSLTPIFPFVFIYFCVLIFVWGWHTSLHSGLTLGEAQGMLRIKPAWSHARHFVFDVLHFCSAEKARFLGVRLALLHSLVLDDIQELCGAYPHWVGQRDVGPWNAREDTVAKVVTGLSK